jgi:cobalamin biosynthesis Mg chelatase CobN
LCYLFYASSTNDIDGNCDDQSSNIPELRLNSYITTENYIYEIDERDQDIQSELNIAEVVLEIHYWCQPNYCNNRTIAELIKKAVKDHYDLSKMYRVLKIKIKEELDEEHNTTYQGKTDSSTNIIITTTSEGETISSSSTDIIVTTTSERETSSSSTDIIVTKTSEGETSSSSTDIIDTMTSEEKTTNTTNSIITITSNTNTTEQSNSIATSFDISIIMIIFNACLILFV